MLNSFYSIKREEIDVLALLVSVWQYWDFAVFFVLCSKIYHKWEKCLHPKHKLLEMQHTTFSSFFFSSTLTSFFSTTGFSFFSFLKKDIMLLLFSEELFARFEAPSFPFCVATLFLGHYFHKISIESGSFQSQANLLHTVFVVFLCLLDSTSYESLSYIAIGSSIQIQENHIHHFQ